MKSGSSSPTVDNFSRLGSLGKRGSLEESSFFTRNTPRSQRQLNMMSHQEPQACSLPG